VNESVAGRSGMESGYGYARLSRRR
jgi:hypothetical protein